MSQKCFSQKSENPFSVHRIELRKCLDDTSSMVLNFSIKIKLVEVKTAVREKGEIEHQVLSKFTFYLGVWNFLDFDAVIKFIGLRNPSSFIG